MKEKTYKHVWYGIRIWGRWNRSVSYKRQGLLTFRSPEFSPGYLVGSVLLIFLIFCVVFFCFACLCPVFFVPNATVHSWLLLQFSLTFILVWSVWLIFLVFCVMFWFCVLLVFVLYFLCPMLPVFSKLSILDWHFGFSLTLDNPSFEIHNSKILVYHWFTINHGGPASGPDLYIFGQHWVVFTTLRRVIDGYDI